jgi:tetratricopeptide (TPR) repeat protein
MSSAAFRVCPACGSRSKLKWEYCAKCGESLQDVAPGDDARPAPARAAEPPAEAISFRIPVGLVVGVAALGVALYAFSQRDTSRDVEPALFTIPTQPPEAPRSSVSAPSVAETAFQRGRDLLSQGRAQEALPYFVQAVADAGNNPLYRTFYGKALWATQEREDAIRQYQAAAQLEPQSPNYSRELAGALMTAGKNEEAARELARLVEMQPQDTDALRSLARLKMSLGAPKEAAELLIQATDARPGDLSVVQDLGFALEQSGALDDASAYYAVILNRRPGAHITRGRLAEVLLKQKRPQDAVETVREGLSLEPQAPLLHRALGSLLERTGDTAGAAVAYREYARLAPKADDAQSLEARAAELERRLTAGTTGRGPGT